MTGRLCVSSDHVRTIAPVLQNPTHQGSIVIAYESGANCDGYGRKSQPRNAVHG
ncbi:hypothetical protein BPTFM16_02155 [Altererythrobacter insulae]|nr:hypothetical protein BPTFM16_02155 [Altererythrobacter insulae]